MKVGRVIQLKKHHTIAYGPKASYYKLYLFYNMPHPVISTSIFGLIPQLVSCFIFFSFQVKSTAIFPCKPLIFFFIFIFTKS